MVEIHEGVRRPDAFLELFTGNHLTGLLEQDLQNLEGLNLQFDPCAALSQLTRTCIDIKVAEADYPLR